MKSRIVVFYGYVGFIGVLIGIGLFVYLLIDEFDSFKPMRFLLLFGLLCLLFYLINTRFWSIKSNEVKIIEEENEILKRQIEKEELKEKLKQFSKTD
jgi:hypothetical protein